MNMYEHPGYMYAEDAAEKNGKVRIAVARNDIEGFRRNVT